MGFIPGQGTKIAHAMQQKQTNKQTNKQKTVGACIRREKRF